MSKSSQVRELLGSGLSAADIAKKVGCTVGLVYNVKSKGGGERRGAGRPPKSRAAVANDLDAFVSSIRHAEKERERLRATLQRVAAVLSEVLN